MNVLVSCCFNFWHHLLNKHRYFHGGSYDTIEVWALEVVIEEVGSMNVLARINDNASTCKAMGALVRRDYSQISWVSCESHSFDLLIKNVGELPWVHVTE